ncbi:MAG: hypothetical protein OMM_03249 [Candidatus Magnetoglobus multicellularis str. Araruama]|uniref:Uncharacterized protein n=1 Tax=Candidatus Magnetoglobus multicellularis str. Araruama TaxID=890399 RepID=A0A1V1P6P7_9BACT|nr:MAG: hypothetical protein OMM_03249 [Candidatus Magnetoglobus multicellularis str. Araruama]
MNKQQKRYNYLKKLEVAIDKDDNCSELDSILNDYYMEFQDTPEEIKQLREQYPEFPKITNFFYESDIDDEEFEYEFEDNDNEVTISEFESELLKIAENGNNDKFISKYFTLVSEIGDIPDQIYEILNKKNILSIVIDAINDRMTICKKNDIANYEITDLLSLIGNIRCNESTDFLNCLLDNYMKELNNYNTEQWKYINVDFFHLLDCMVKQQNKKSVSHIINARNLFPEEYTEYIVCQIAAGRITKGKVEGYLPMEAMEICIPSGRVMQALSGNKYEYKDDFDELYGEYFKINY